MPGMSVMSGLAGSATCGCHIQNRAVARLVVSRQRAMSYARRHRVTSRVVSHQPRCCAPRLSCEVVAIVPLDALDGRSECTLSRLRLLPSSQQHAVECTVELYSTRYSSQQ